MFGTSSVISAYPLYRQLTPAYVSQQTAKMAKSATVQSEIAYFKKKVETIKTPDEFVKDYRLLKFALTAYGLEDQLQYPARIQQIMKDDPEDPRALVRRMTSVGYREINAAFDFFKSGVTKLKDPNFQQTLIAKYTSQRYEISLGEINPNISDALYFERMIGKAKNGYEVIGDKVLFEVAKTALNMPPGAVTAKVERLRQWIEREMDFKRLNDPAYVKKLSHRFLMLKDVEAQKGSSRGLIDIFA